MTEGIRKLIFDMSNRKSSRQSLSLPYGRQLPLHKGAMVGGLAPPLLEQESHGGVCVDSFCARGMVGGGRGIPLHKKIMKGAALVFSVSAVKGAGFPAGEKE